ncbi:MAG: endolytic transglycosylase MltG [Ilumatobacteraceae bacterium]
MPRRPDPLLDPETDDQWVDDVWDDIVGNQAAIVEQTARRHGIVKWLVFIASALIVIGLLTGGAIGWWYIRQVNPSGESSERVTFTVTETDTLESISLRLQDERVITNARVFRYYVESKGGLTITPGYYELNPRDHMGNLMRVLNTPPAATYKRVTFPEGFTISQMGARVERDLPPMTAAGFAAAAASGQVRSPYQSVGNTSMEGLLFPDTYQVAGNETEVQVVQRMANLMERVGRQVNLEQGAVDLGLTPYQVLIVASMIEREAKFDDDRPKIARVIYNRLSSYFDMPLQIDATLYYGQDSNTPFSELRQTPGPYNTYLNLGLPPTPIANPGRASIEAALHPANNPTQGDPLCTSITDGSPCVYLYYVVSDEDGHHAFAATLDQHNANVRAAREAGLLA